MQDFQPSVANWVSNKPIKTNKHNWKFTDCGSGVGRPSFLWFNGYLAIIISSYKGVSVHDTNSGSTFDVRCSALRYLLSMAFAAMCVVALASSSALFASTSGLALKSPKGTLTGELRVDVSGTIAYSVNRDAEPLLLPSRLGLEPNWASGFTIASSARAQHRGSWKPRVWRTGGHSQ